ncbi:hypothetical protein [Sanyastnella coralliicola]|uniref:hypothetical protein n=1 Tax=Sanyastnella coralliicola TaxID=3069118 RepID=UPI0027B95658|nr:hypothetical protein [Longitalea sp. SCSIO 12813]
MIVFNFLAIAQALIAVLVVVALHFLLQLFGLDVDLIGGTYEAWASLLIIGFVSMMTETLGLRGRIFWIPVWMLAIAGSLFMFYTWNFPPRYDYFKSEYVDVNTVPEHITVLLGSALTIYLFFKRNAAYWRKKFQKASEAMAGIRHMEQTGELTMQQFWANASHAYIDPPFLFLYAYWLWKILFPNSFTDFDFIVHYRDLLSRIDMESITKSGQREYLNSFLAAVNAADSFKDYNHPGGSLKRLADAINDKV